MSEAPGEHEDAFSPAYAIPVAFMAMRSSSRADAESSLDIFSSMALAIEFELVPSACQHHRATRISE